MREIKFRGISEETGKFVYGDLIQTKPNKVDGKFSCWIKERSVLGLGAESTPTSSFIKVKPETVGQFTGLLDIGEVEIYENDTVDCWDECGFVISQNISGVVTFNGGGFCVKGSKGYHNRLALTCAEKVSVTGNIHQNLN